MPLDQELHSLAQRVEKSIKLLENRATKTGIELDAILQDILADKQLAKYEPEFSRMKDFASEASYSALDCARVFLTNFQGIRDKVAMDVLLDTVVSELREIEPDATELDSLSAYEIDFDKLSFSEYDDPDEVTDIEFGNPISLKTQKDLSKTRALKALTEITQLRQKPETNYQQFSIDVDDVIRRLQTAISDDVNNIEMIEAAPTDDVLFQGDFDFAPGENTLQSLTDLQKQLKKPDDTYKDAATYLTDLFYAERLLLTQSALEVLGHKKESYKENTPRDVEQGHIPLIHSILDQARAEISLIPDTHELTQTQAQEKISAIINQADQKIAQIIALTKQADAALRHFGHFVPKTVKQIEVPENIQVAKTKEERQQVENAVVKRAMAEIKDIVDKAATNPEESQKRLDAVIKNAKIDLAKVSGTRHLTKQIFYDQLTATFPKIHIAPEDQMIGSVLSDITRQMTVDLEDPSISYVDFVLQCRHAIANAKTKSQEAAFQRQLEPIETFVTKHGRTADSLEPDAVYLRQLLKDERDLYQSDDIRESMAKDIRHIQQTGLLPERSALELFDINGQLSEQRRVIKEAGRQDHPQVYQRVLDEQAAKQMELSLDLSVVAMHFLHHELETALSSFKKDVPLVNDESAEEIINPPQDYVAFGPLVDDEEVPEEVPEEDVEEAVADGPMGGWVVGGIELQDQRSLARWRANKAAGLIQAQETQSSGFAEYQQSAAKTLSTLNELIEDDTRKTYNYPQAAPPTDTQELATLYHSFANKDAKTYLADALSAKITQLTPYLSAQDKTVQDAARLLSTTMQEEVKVLRDNYLMSRTPTQTQELTSACRVLQNQGFQLGSLGLYFQSTTTSPERTIQAQHQAEEEQPTPSAPSAASPAPVTAQDFLALEGLLAHLRGLAQSLEKPVNLRRVLGDIVADELFQPYLTETMVKAIDDPEKPPAANAFIFQQRVAEVQQQCFLLLKQKKQDLVSAAITQLDAKISQIAIPKTSYIDKAITETAIQVRIGGAQQRMSQLQKNTELSLHGIEAAIADISADLDRQIQQVIENNETADRAIDALMKAHGISEQDLKTPPPIPTQAPKTDHERRQAEKAIAIRAIQDLRSEVSYQAFDNLEASKQRLTRLDDITKKADADIANVSGLRQVVKQILCDELVFSFPTTKPKGTISQARMTELLTTSKHKKMTAAELEHVKDHLLAELKNGFKAAFKDPSLNYVQFRAKCEELIKEAQAKFAKAKVHHRDMGETQNFDKVLENLRQKTIKQADEQSDTLSDREHLALVLKRKNELLKAQKESVTSKIREAQIGIRGAVSDDIRMVSSDGLLVPRTEDDLVIIRGHLGNLKSIHFYQSVEQHQSLHPAAKVSPAPKQVVQAPQKTEPEPAPKPVKAPPPGLFDSASAKIFEDLQQPKGLSLEELAERVAHLQELEHSLDNPEQQTSTTLNQALDRILSDTELAGHRDEAALQALRDNAQKTPVECARQFQTTLQKILKGISDPLIDYQRNKQVALDMEEPMATSQAVAALREKYPDFNYKAIKEELSDDDLRTMMLVKAKESLGDMVKDGLVRVTDLKAAYAQKRVEVEAIISQRASLSDKQQIIKDKIDAIAKQRLETEQIALQGTQGSLRLVPITFKPIFARIDQATAEITALAEDQALSLTELHTKIDGIISARDTSIIILTHNAKVAEAATGKLVRLYKINDIDNPVGHRQAIACKAIKDIQAVIVENTSGNDVRKTINAIAAEAERKIKVLLELREQAKDAEAHFKEFENDKVTQIKAPDIIYLAKSKAERMQVENAIAKQAKADIARIMDRAYVDPDGSAKQLAEVIKNAKTKIGKVSGVRQVIKQIFYDEFTTAFPALTAENTRFADNKGRVHPDVNTSQTVLNNIRREMTAALEDPSVSYTEFKKKAHQAIEDGERMFRFSEQVSQTFEQLLHDMKRATELRTTVEMPDSFYLMTRLMTEANSPVQPEIGKDVKRLSDDGLLTERTREELAALNEQIRTMQPPVKAYQRVIEAQLPKPQQIAPAMPENLEASAALLARIQAFEKSLQGLEKQKPVDINAKLATIIAEEGLKSFMPQFGTMAQAFENPTLSPQEVVAVFAEQLKSMRVNHPLEALKATKEKYLDALYPESDFDLDSVLKKYPDVALTNIYSPPYHFTEMNEHDLKDILLFQVKEKLRQTKLQDSKVSVEQLQEAYDKEAERVELLVREFPQRKALIERTLSVNIDVATLTSPILASLSKITPFVLTIPRQIVRELTEQALKKQSSDINGLLDHQELSLKQLPEEIALINTLTTEQIRAYADNSRLAIEAIDKLVKQYNIMEGDFQADEQFRLAAFGAEKAIAIQTIIQIQEALSDPEPNRAARKIRIISTNGDLAIDSMKPFMKRAARYLDSDPATIPPNAALAIQAMADIQALLKSNPAAPDLKAQIKTLADAALSKINQVEHVIAIADIAIEDLTQKYVKSELEETLPTTPSKPAKNKDERDKEETAIARQAITKIRQATQTAAADPEGSEKLIQTAVKDANIALGKVSGKVRDLAKKDFYNEFMSAFPIPSQVTIDNDRMDALLGTNVEHSCMTSDELRAVKYKLYQQIKSEIEESLEDPSLDYTKFRLKCFEAVKRADEQFLHAKKYRDTTLDAGGGGSHTYTVGPEQLLSSDATHSFDQQIRKLQQVSMPLSFPVKDADHLKAALDRDIKALDDYVPKDPKKQAAKDALLKAMRADRDFLETHGVLSSRSGNEINSLITQLKTLAVHDHATLDRARGRTKTTSETITQFYQTVLEEQYAQFNKGTEELAGDFLHEELMAELRDLVPNVKEIDDMRAFQLLGRDPGEVSDNEFAQLKHWRIEGARQEIDQLSRPPKIGYSGFVANVNNILVELRENINTDRGLTNAADLPVTEAMSETDDPTLVELDKLQERIAVDKELLSRTNATLYLANELQSKRKALSNFLDHKQPGQTVLKAAQLVLKAMEADEFALRNGGKYDGQVVPKSEHTKDNLIKACEILEKGDTTFKSSVVRFYRGHNIVKAAELTNHVGIYKKLLAKDKTDEPPAPSIGPT